MESLISKIPYLVYGVFGLLLLMFVFAALFGKHSRKRRRFEARFLDMGGREFGEFGLKMSRIGRDKPGYSVKARFRMQHESLARGLEVRVYVDDLRVLEGRVGRNGRISLSGKSVIDGIEDPPGGQVCRVVWSAIEQFRAPVRAD